MLFHLLSKKFLPRIIVLLISVIFFFSCNTGNESETIPITFSVSVNKNTEIKNVFISGNTDELGNWEAGSVKLDKINDTLYSKTLLLNKGKVIEYKYTLGSWFSEALTKHGQIPPNSVHKVKEATTLYTKVDLWRTEFVEGGLFMTSSLITDSSITMTLESNWKFSSNDSIVFASPDYKDSHWQKTESFLLPDSNSDGIGWYRLKMICDSSVWGKPFAIRLLHLGASEIYFNGRKIFKVGEIGNDKTEYQPQQNRMWRLFTFSHEREQYFAVRYKNNDAEYYRDLNFHSGFSIYLKNPNLAIRDSNLEIRTQTIYQALYTLIPIILAIIHFLLFWFYPKSIQNLYYSICLVGFAAISYANIEKFIATDPDLIVFYYRMVAPSVAVAIYFGMLMGYKGIYIELPKRQYLFLTISLIIGIYGYFVLSVNVYYLLYVLLTFSVIEFIYIFLKKKKAKGIDFIVTFSFFILLLSIIYQVLLDMGILPPLGEFRMVYGIGLLAIILAMSLSLSYEFAFTNKALEEQLRLTMLRENEIREREVEKRILEADNKRKTKELEEARRLQLSFLPKALPKSEGYEFAAYMKTASEVGGDYYDFSQNENSLTIVIGDATGHGAKAGIMVAATKSLFNIISVEKEPLVMINKFNTAIKSMNLHNLYMAMTVCKLSENRLKVSNAGMPPFLKYNKNEDSVSEIMMKSMPLGGFTNFPYTEIELNFEEGDIFIFLSDGFTELFNKNRELLGIEKAKEIVKKNNSESPERIISLLIEEMSAWSLDKPFEDDITFLVIKRKLKTDDVN